MLHPIVHIGLLVAGAAIPWFLSKHNRKDKLAMGLGVASGATISFAIAQSPWLLLALVLLVPILALRIRVLRRKPVTA